VYKNSDDEKTLENVDYRLYAAREALAAAQTRLKIIQQTSGVRVREAQAGVLAAEAQKDIAQAELNLLKVGRAGWEIEIAEAAVAQARVALTQAETALQRTVLTAPFAGTITRVNVEVGNMLSPGQAVGVLAALDSLQVRTIDLTELDVTRVQEGAPVVVSVDALPDQSFDGVVHKIAHRPGDYRGDVVYAVIVDLNHVDDMPLKWGMTAMVEIQTN
ncbi:MAG TPA: HlyD family efflux transporter periplasmic adaptor subunit, partial [Chloroflexi bacterium]|nr:HlyD family efflux transporter periplasmic adaptor subunit [Chloroflexota bacterium]